MDAIFQPIKNSDTYQIKLLQYKYNLGIGKQAKTLYKFLTHCAI